MHKLHTSSFLEFCCSTKESRWKHIVDKIPGLTYFTGAAHIIASRGFVDFALNAPMAKEILTMMSAVKIPDELFFNTLNHNPHLGAPGAAHIGTTFKIVAIVLSLSYPLVLKMSYTCLACIP